MAVYSIDRHFCIYSDSISSTPDGATAGAVWLDQDPIWGTYDPLYEYALRGRVVETISWRITQIFPYVEESAVKGTHRRKILLQDKDAMSRATVQSLHTMYSSYGTIYKFWDGESLFRVWFSLEPPGLKVNKSLTPWREGLMRIGGIQSSDLFYSYEILLDVLEVMSTPEF